MGLRILDHFCVIEILRKSLVEFGVINICIELLDSESHETILSSLSLLTGLVTPTESEAFLSNGILKPICRLLVHKDIEFLFYILKLLDVILATKARVRQNILKIGLPDLLNRNLKHNSDLQKSPVLHGTTRRVKAEIEVHERLLKMFK